MPEEEATNDTPVVEETAPTPEEAEAQLKAELAAVRAELEQCQDRFLRKAAEFDNYRKRMEREKGDAVILAKSTVLLEFLPVADACERALASLNEDQDGNGIEQYREGVRLLYKQINDVLTRVGVVRIEALLQEFDPHLHEAITRDVSAEHEENTVLKELRHGYLFRDRLLRPAQVIVSTRPPEKESES
jgi:molecular chaperone GrpE